MYLFAARISDSVFPSAPPVRQIAESFLHLTRYLLSELVILNSSTTESNLTFLNFRPGRWHRKKFGDRGAAVEAA